MPEARDRRNWTKVAFGDVVRLSKERSSDPLSDGLERYVGLEHIEPNDLKIRSWGDIANGTTFTSVFRPGQVLFGKRRAYQRKIAVADFIGVCSGDIYVLEPSNEKLLPELLPFICQTDSFFEHAVGTSAGSLSPRTNWKSLSEYEFALPPLEEQRRIVEALREVDEAREKLICLEGSLATLLDSAATRVLHQARLKQLYERTHVEASVGWRIVSFGDVCRRITYGFTNPMPSVEQGPWMITAADINDGRVDYGTARHTTQYAFDHDLTQKSRPSVGDVLLTKDGTLGRVAVLDRDSVCVNQSVAVLSPSEAILPSYLAWTLRAPVMQWRLMLDSGGSAVKHLYITKVAATRFLLPPLEEQRNAVRLLETLSVVMSAARERAESLTGISRRISSMALGRTP